MKKCYICGEYENPYKGHPEYKEADNNPNNFVTINWIGKSTTDAAHDECWEVNK